MKRRFKKYSQWTDF
jgi:hypothetical protein